MTHDLSQWRVLISGLRELRFFQVFFVAAASLERACELAKRAAEAAGARDVRWEERDTGPWKRPVDLAPPVRGEGVVHRSGVIYWTQNG